MTLSTIDWEFWLSMQEVKVWQAIALSLGIDPDKMNQSQDYWRNPPADADVSNARTRKEFGERQRLLVASLADTAFFTPGLHSSDTPANHRVRLAQVAEWLGSIARMPLADSFLSAMDTGNAPRAAANAVVPLAEKRPSRTEQQKMLAWQEEQVRRATRSLGFDPLALPPDDRKIKFFVKSVIRTRCEKNHPVTMRFSIFNKAWDRMLSSTPLSLKYSD